MAYTDTADERIKLLGTVYHARFSKNGIRVQESLKTKNFKIAVQLANDIEKSILLGEDWKKEKGLFDELWPVFLSDKAKGRQQGKGIRKASEKTLKQYIHFGERYYLPFFGSKDSVSEEQRKDAPLKNMRVDKMGGVWDEYLEFARSKSKSGDATKMKNHWMYMSGFMTWAKAVGHIKETPAIYNPDETGEDDDTPGRNLTDQQLLDLRSNATGPMAVWIHVAQFMGMRSFEISQLLKSRIDLEKDMINLGRAAKGGRPRVVPIHPTVRPFLVKQMEAHPESPYLFPNAIDSKRPMDIAGFKKPWAALRNSLGIECVFKDFRSSHATRAFTAVGANPVLVCLYLGMSMRVAMKHYIKPDESKLGALMKGFSL